MCSAKWVKVNVTDCEQPLFGEVKNIYVGKGSDLLCIQVLPMRPVRHSTDLLLHITLKFAP